jgi:cytochrome bd-type quinol oxidase subunit 2
MRRMKYVLVSLAFLAIFASLGSALFFMMREGDGRPKTNNMARALAFRVGFSILLFVCILVAWKLGYIKPTGIPLQ